MTNASRRLLVPMIALAIALPAVARADVISTTTSISGAPSAPGIVNNIDLSGVQLTTPNPGAPGYFGSTSPYTTGTGAAQVTITPVGGGSIPNGTYEPAAFVSGTQNSNFNAPVYAAPITSGAGLPITTVTGTYLSTGLGTITVAFAAKEQYLGLLWGSVGVGNTVTLYNGTTQVGQITGVQIMATPGYNMANFSQGPGGSVYTLINDMGGSFTSAVFSETSGNPSFEFANLQFAAQNVVAPVPEPASAALLGAGLLGLVAVPMIRRRRSGC